MRLIDKLAQKRTALLEAMNATSEKAASEERTFTDDEQTAFNRDLAEVQRLDVQIAAQAEANALLRGDQTARVIQPGPQGPRLIDSDGNVIRALTRNDRLVDTLPAQHRTMRADEPPPSMARALRGIISGDWSRATRIERAMGEGVLAGGGYAVPSELSAMWLDNARSASVCMQAGAITIPMNTATMRIVRVDGDPTVYFRQEHQPITESDLIFGAVDLKARTAGILCRVSVELLEDSPIANAAIEQAMSAAMGLAFDRAMLAGTGVVVAPADNPTGLLYAANVNEIAAAAAPAYVTFLNAYGLVLANNGTPNAWVMGTNTLMDLAKLTTATNEQMPVFQPLDSLGRYATTSLNDQKVADESASVIGDFTQLGLALRTGLTLEASRTAADALSKVQVLIRLYARIDVAILRPKFFTRILGLTSPPPP